MILYSVPLMKAHTLQENATESRVGCPGHQTDTSHHYGACPKAALVRAAFMPAPSLPCIPYRIP